MIIDSGIVTGSFQVIGNTEITGSLKVTEGITGSLKGNAESATSSSYALSASYAQNVPTAISASYALSASSVPYSGLTGTVPTWNQNTTGTAATASYVQNAVSASYALNATNAINASSATSASYALNATNAASSISASNAVNADTVDGRHASEFVLNSATSSLATQTYVNTAVSNLVDAAPGTLDTLNELAAALGDDPNFATTVATSIGTKQNQLNGTGFVKASGTTISYDNSTYTPTSRTLTINGTSFDLSADRSWSIAAGVTSFNTRTGGITLTSGDVTTALGYTPYNATNPNGYISSYTETDTLATVTGRGASTSTDLTFNGQLTLNKSGTQLRISRADSASANWFFHSWASGLNIYPDAAGTVFFGRDGSATNVDVFNGNLFQQGNQVLHAGNYTSYSPTLTGGSASGTWGISITGNADTVDNYHASSFTKQAYVNTGYNFNTLAAENSDSAIVYRLESSVSNPPSNTIYNWSLWQQGNSTRGSQIAVGAYGGNEIYFRGANNDSGAYRGWQRVLHDGNYTSYAVPTTRTITINGTALDLSADRSFTVTATETDTLATVTGRGASTGTPIIMSGGSGTTSTLVLDRNIATPSNYYSGLQLEVKATSGTAGIGLHRSGFSHVGIYHDSSNELKFNMNSGTPVLGAGVGTIIGSGNYNSYAPTLTGGGASGTWEINITGTSRGIIFSGDSAKQIADGQWAGGGSYPGYAFVGGNSRFGFSSTSGVIDVYTDGNFYATDSSHLVLHAGNFTSYSPSLTGGSASGTWEINITGTAFGLNASNYISRTGSSGNLNTDFQNTPAGTFRYQGDDVNLANSPGGAWWIYENKRHSNGSSFWGTQVAWGWEDNANRLATRNITGGSFGGWVYYLNSSNFNSYSPTLTGGNASGTWGINITGNAGSVGGIGAGSFVRNDTYNSANAGLQVFRNIGTTTPSWQDSNHTLSLENGDAGHLVLNFHRAGYTSNNLVYNGSTFNFDLTIVSSGDVVAFSDKRVKENINTIEGALEKVSKLRGVTYNRVDSEDKLEKIGVIAQEVQEVLPQVVHEQQDGMLGVSYGNLAGLFIEAIKEQQTQIEELKELVKQLTQK